MIITQDRLIDKKYSPQRLYNRLKKLMDCIDDAQLCIDKIMIKADTADNLKFIHQELFVSYIKCKYIIDNAHRVLRCKK